jgi:hypothetical protein
MISVVNGYLCTTSCEAAAARAGKDPHAPPGTPPGQSGKADKNSPFANQPATVLGGALKKAVNAVTTTDSATPSNNSQPTIDLLA